MRSALVLTMLLLPFLAGCTEPVQEPDPKDGLEPEPEPEPEPWTRRLYLLFPDPCPEEPIGNTTYNTSMETIGERYCGNGAADMAVMPPPCATFFVHDPEYRLYEGQRVAADIVIEGGPGPTRFRLSWVDDEGVVAEGIDDLGFGYGRGFVTADVESNVQRNSTTGLRFEVHAEEAFSCGRIGVGANGGRASAIWVIED